MSDSSFSNVKQLDIAIIGGGIAGSSLAITMQRAGWTTALVEREPEFRDRVRGEACHPWGVKELLELDLMPFVQQIGGLELRTWTRYAERELEMQFRWDEAFPGSPPELGFNHPDLQQALIEGAEVSGALIFRPARASIAGQRDGWLLHIEQQEETTDVKSRFLVAADGKNSGTRHLWGGETIADEQHHTFGGMLASGIDLPQDSAHQGYHEAGFSMLFPQGGNRWRVYLVGPIEYAREFTGGNREARYLAACANCFPKGAFANVDTVGPLAFFSNAHTSGTKIVGPLAVAIGDAAGAGDPSQGHGMSLVWRDVRELRDLLVSHELEDVPAMFGQKRREYEHVLRTHATWVAPLITDTGKYIVDLKAQVEAAREADRTALGYAGIFANGPDSLPSDNSAKAEFFGEHLTNEPVTYGIALDKYE